MLTPLNRDTTTFTLSPNDVPVMSAEKVLQIVQASGAGKAGGLNWGSNRLLANVQQNERTSKLKNDLELKTLEQLKSLIIDSNLPIPNVWVKKPYLVNIKERQHDLKLFLDCGAKNNTGEEPSTKKKKVEIVDITRDKISDVFNVNDKIKIQKNETISKICAVNSINDNDDSDSSDFLGTLRIQEEWTDASLSSGFLYKQQEATRKEKFINILIMKDNSENTNNMSGTGTKFLHESGFSALYSLIAGDVVNCPLCLDAATRPTVTLCVHVHCLQCISSVIEREGNLAKCTVCRRPINMSQLMEIEPTSYSSSSNDMDNSNVINEIHQENGPINDSNVYQNTKEKNLDQSSSSSSTNFTPNLLSLKNNATEFIIPEDLNHQSLACTEEELNEMKTRYFNYMFVRDSRYPSIEPIFLQNFHQLSRLNVGSSRFNSVLLDIYSVLNSDPFAKFVIFSQYSESLKAFQEFLEKLNDVFQCVIIDGKSSSSDKNTKIRTFIEDPGCNICLLTTGSSACGLTLTVSHTCYMLEPIHNAAEESQALNRIHRIGQAQSIRCVIFYARGTCEERLLSMRQSMGSLTSALSNNYTHMHQVNEKELNFSGQFFNVQQLSLLFGCNSD